MSCLVVYNIDVCCIILNYMSNTSIEDEASSSFIIYLIQLECAVFYFNCIFVTTMFIMQLKALWVESLVSLF